MTHTDKGNYGRKHDSVKTNAAVLEAIRNKASDKTISCAAAHAVAKKCGTSPAEVGKAIDVSEVCIVSCQLGIFKHSSDRPAQAVPEITPELEQTITSRLTNGRLSCEAAWSIAKDHRLTRLQMGAACDHLGIKINACQLGTFG
jgi:hypothetical protein